MSASTPLPDLLVIGDSHSNALLEGCEAHGIRADMLRFSGNFWHANCILFHREHGLWVRRSQAMQQQILALRERIGGRSLINPDIPILTTAGFQLGRLVPPFGFTGHQADPAAFRADPNAHFSSSALVAAYAGRWRAPHLHLVRRMARFGNLTVVVPPNVFGASNFTVFRKFLAGQMQAHGLPVIDPSAELWPSGGTLPPEYITPDGVHGNGRYGEQAIGLLLARGLIGKRAA